MYSSNKLEEFYDLSLAPYAVKHKNHRRHGKENDRETFRTNFRRDRDRIISCKLFRRLQHKTQVFVSVKENHFDTKSHFDHYRNRLSHTLEVDQIATSISYALRLNTDLTSAISLGHDMGHTPFGHSGERTLDKMISCGKEDGTERFFHSTQSLRYINVISKKAKDESNLDDIDIHIKEGILKHDTDIINVRRNQIDSQLYPSKLANINLFYPSFLEAQLVYWADKFAYICHDWDDYVSSNLIRSAPKDQLSSMLSDFLRLFKSYLPNTDLKKIKSIDNIKLRDVLFCLCSSLITNTSNNIESLLRKQGKSEDEINSEFLVEECKTRYVNNLRKKFKVKYIERVINNTFKDVTDVTDILKKNAYIKHSNDHQKVIKHINEIKKKCYMDAFIVNLPKPAKRAFECLRQCIKCNFVDSPEVKAMDKKGSDILAHLFTDFSNSTQYLPLVTQSYIENVDRDKNRIICDHLAGMTDHYAMQVFSVLNHTAW